MAKTVNYVKLSGPTGPRGDDRSAKTVNYVKLRQRPYGWRALRLAIHAVAAVPIVSSG